MRCNICRCVWDQIV